MSTTSAINTLSNQLEKGLHAIKEPIGYGIMGYLATRIFTKINPTAGFLVGTTTTLVHKMSKSLFDKVFANPESNQSSRKLGKILHSISSIAIGYQITNLVTPISFANAAALSLFPPLLLTIAVVGVIFAAAVLFGVIGYVANHANAD